MIRTPDQRLRVFVSSTLGELAEERTAARRAIEQLHLTPVMFELGARPHPPRDLYRAYLAQSHVFVGIYWQRYGWVAPGESVSGLEDELRLASGMPQLIYIKEPAPDREAALTELLRLVQSDDRTSYRRFHTTGELEELVAGDLAVLLSERFETVAAPPATAPGPAAVPAVLTRTIGREAEVEGLHATLDAGGRLVTITGPGGVGKTRLALEVAHERSRRAGAVVHYVPLAAVTSPGLVMAAVADQLAVREAARSSPLDALVAHLGSAPALLVLDNLEQVIGVAPEVQALVERAPGLQVLATSRQPLRVRGEVEVPVGPLGTPAHDAGADQVAVSPSVQLVVDRAGAMGGRFELTAGNAPAVAELCRRLGGLPLALELVAAHLRLLSPQQLLERLRTGLDLGGAPADLPARQRTLRTTLDWSHDLLGDAEQRLFAHLGVFGGGATLDAVEQVCGDGADLMGPLAGLLDKSLVVTRDSAPDGELRFEMLVPVAEYSRERLAARDDHLASRQRHLAYFSRLGSQAQPYLCGPYQREWAARIDAEHANLRLAMETGLETHEWATALRLVWDTLVFFYIRDAMEEPRQWLRDLASAPHDFDDVRQALLDVALVIVGDPPDEHDVPGLLGRAVPVLEADGLPLEAAVSQHHLGVYQWRSGDRAAAVRSLEAASQRYAALEHDWGVATVEMTLGAVLTALGERDAAVRHHLASLEHSRRIDNRPQVAQGLQGVALAEALSGHTQEAHAALDEAVDIVVADRSMTLSSYCLEALAALALRADDPAQAVRLVSTARATRRTVSAPEWTAATDAADRVLEEARGALPDADFTRAWREGVGADALAVLESRVPSARR